jgi:triacylglycerol lipase
MRRRILTLVLTLCTVPLLVGFSCSNPTWPVTLFADDLDDPEGTPLDDKLPDQGLGKWVASGSPSVQGGAVDTFGGAREAFGTFEQPLAAGEKLQVFVTTTPTAGTFFSGGFAGFSLYAGGSERVYVGDPSGPSSAWVLEETGVQSVDTALGVEATRVMVEYTFDTGELRFVDFGGTGTIETLAGPAGWPIDQIRLANGGGGDFAVDDVEARIIPGTSTVLAFNDYPVVLAHGLFGSDSYEIGGTPILDYWFGIEAAMEAEGADVYVTQTSPIGSSYVRGALLLEQVEEILASTGADKVHIIGHSQGGLDARYVAGTRPDLVRSVTTVATPNKGASVAAFFADNIDTQGNILAPLFNLFGSLVEEFARMITGSTDPLDWKAAFSFLGDMDQFNVDFPDGLPVGCHPGAPEVDGINYYSWTGNIVGLFVVRIITNVLDLTDPLLNTASLFYGLFEANDGLVTVCSSQFGDVLGDDYLMNHVDTINHIIGLASPLEVSPVQLYRDHVHRLLALPQ